MKEAALRKALERILAQYPLCFCNANYMGDRFLCAACEARAALALPLDAAGTYQCPTCNAACLTPLDVDALKERVRADSPSKVRA